MCIKILIHYNLTEPLVGVSAALRERFSFSDDYVVTDSDINDGFLHTITLHNFKERAVKITVSKMERTPSNRNSININYTDQSEEALVVEMFTRLLEVIPQLEDPAVKAHFHFYDQQTKRLDKVMPELITNLNKNYLIEDEELDPRMSYFSVSSVVKACLIIHLAKDEKEVEDIENEVAFLDASDDYLTINCEGMTDSEITKALITELRRILINKAVPQKKLPSMWEEF